jgi:predicted deacylase
MPIGVPPLSREPASDAPAARLEPIDLSAYAEGNTGVDYVTTFESAAPGPHVMVNALMHGNELCGAHALVALLERGVRPRRGRLTLSFANVEAYLGYDERDPIASRFIDEDLNRVWAPARLESPPRSREVERARALRPVIDQVDYLLDLHSMTLPGPPLMLCGETEKGRSLARAIGFPTHVVADAGHAAGTRLRDYGPFADPKSAKTALLIECGQHNDAASAEVALEMTMRFLDHFELVDGEHTAPYPAAPPPGGQRLIEVSEAVTVESDDFTFAREFENLEVVAAAGTTIAEDGGKSVRTPYDDCVLVMPSQHLKPGHTAVRLGRFVE